LTLIIAKLFGFLAISGTTCLSSLPFYVLGLWFVKRYNENNRWIKHVWTVIIIFLLLSVIAAMISTKWSLAILMLSTVVFWGLLSLFEIQINLLQMAKRKFLLIGVIIPIFTLALLCYFISELTLFFATGVIGALILIYYQKDKILVLFFSVIAFMHSSYYFILETFFRTCPHYMVENVLRFSIFVPKCENVFLISPCFFAQIISLTLVVFIITKLLSGKT